MVKVVKMDVLGKEIGVFVRGKKGGELQMWKGIKYYPRA